ncbi:MAG: hypothetical protein M3458_06680 [Acidobacteriota bacterium]|nr:hypothetical protein [Acidobacteriota bacterium]
MNETMKILIAYDGSPCAEAGIDDLQKVGLPLEDTGALVISVAEVLRAASRILRTRLSSWLSS